jgi:hypothetical protein
MTRLALLISAILALPPLGAQGAQSVPSMPIDVAVAGTASDEALAAFAMRRGAGGARAGGARTAHVNRGHVASRPANLHHNVNRNVNRNLNRNVNINRDVNINRNIARVGVGGIAAVRPIRPWVRRPYYGTIIAGITLGTIIYATAVPVVPDPSLCWFWSNSSHTRGYWDYCQ